jgi:hypothetical protein
MGENEIITNISIDGCEFKGISDFNVSRETINKYVSQNTVISFNDDFTITATCRISRIKLYKVIGLYDWAIQNCPNKRVVHLMRYGKNARVKMKNFRRSLRIIEKVLRGA